MNKFLRSTSFKISPFDQNYQTTIDHNKDEYSVFIESINFILYLKNPWKLINNCPNETLNCLRRTNEINFKNINTFDYLTDEKKLEFIEIMIDYIKYIHENLNELIIQKHTKNFHSDHYSTIKFDLLHKFSLIMWTWADKSSDFCIKLHDLRFIKILFKLLNDTGLINHITERLKSHSNDQLYFKLAFSYKSFLGLVHNLSKYQHLYTDQWKDSNCFNCLLRLCIDFESLKMLDISLLSYFSLINLIDEKNSDCLNKLTDLNKILLNVMGLINECSSKLSLNEPGYRRVYKIENEGLNEISTVCSNEIVWRLTELINFLINLVDLNDKFKYEIYEVMHGKVYLSRVLYNGNIIEKEYVLRLIWKLSSDLRVGDSVKNDLNLYSFILGLSLNQFNKNKVLLKYSNYILFLLNHSSNDLSYYPENSRGFLKNTSLRQPKNIDYDFMSRNASKNLVVHEDVSF